MSEAEVKSEDNNKKEDLQDKNKEAANTPRNPNEALTNLFKPVSDDLTFRNMNKLTRQTEYIIADKTYKRKMLKPKELVQFIKLQEELTIVGETDIEKKLPLFEKMALLTLEGFTHEDFENTDVLLLEQVMAACFLISRGFREI